MTQKYEVQLGFIDLAAEDAFYLHVEDVEAREPAEAELEARRLLGIMCPSAMILDHHTKITPIAR